MREEAQVFRINASSDVASMIHSHLRGNLSNECHVGDTMSALFLIALISLHPQRSVTRVVCGTIKDPASAIRLWRTDVFDLLRGARQPMRADDHDV